MDAARAVFATTRDAPIVVLDCSQVLMSCLFSVDGKWGHWSPWTSCSATCGAAKRSRTRECDHPPAAHGGKTCEGPEKQEEYCKLEPCMSKFSIRFLSFWSRIFVGSLSAFKIIGFFKLFIFRFQSMATTPTGAAGPSVTSHAVVGTDSGHVPALVLYQSMAGSTVRILGLLCSLMFVTQGPVHVSIIEDPMSIT